MPMIIALDDREDYGEDRWIGIGMLKSRVVVVVYSEEIELMECRPFSSKNQILQLRSGRSFDYAQDDITQRKEPKALIPCPEDQFWHRLVQDLFQEAKLVYPRLDAFYELGTILSYYKSRINWKEILHRAERFQMEELLHTVLFLLHRDMFLPLPQKMHHRSFPKRELRRQWYHKAASLPKALFYALNTFNLILMIGQGYEKVKVAYKTLIVDRALRESEALLMKMYVFQKRSFLLPIRLIHLVRVIVLQLVVTGYYLSFLTTNFLRRSYHRLRERLKS